jgi:hypothetical protein
MKALLLACALLQASAQLSFDAASIQGEHVTR